MASRGLLLLLAALIGAAATVRRQGAYGIAITPYPWLGRPTTPGASCQGGVDRSSSAHPLCFFDTFGNTVTRNKLWRNGSFGNATNGDLADGSTGSFFGPLGAQIACATEAFGPCGGTAAPVLGAFAAIARAVHERAPALHTTDLARSLARYPAATHVTAPAPRNQSTMPDPCSGVPTNAWCPGH